MIKMLFSKKKLIMIALFALIGILSATVMASFFSSVDTYQHTFTVLDKEKSRVTALLAASTGASAVITLIPDDTCTPIADKLAGLSYCFVFVLSILYSEKYLLTFIGLVVFRIIVPVACFSSGVVVIWPSKIKWWEFTHKLVIVGVIIFSLIPISALVSGMIEETFHETIDATISAAISSDTVPEAEEEEDKGWFQSIIDEVVNSATGAINWAKTILNSFVEATAIVLVTSCLIPILVCVCILTLMKKAFDIDMPLRPGKMPLPKNHKDK